MTAVFCYLRAMPRSPGWCGVILAAGESSRMGTDKAMLRWPPGAVSNQTFLSAAVRSRVLFNDMVIVVAGRNESTIESEVYATNASMVRNPEPERGQFSSLQVGLQAVLNRGRDAAMITHVDRPPAERATLAVLRDAFVASPDEKWAVVPEFRGKHGHPILVSRDMIEVFLKAPATAVAREIEHQHQHHIEYFPVDDPRVTLNVNTPEEYAALVSAYGR
jgi:molybdenum cofactor cytidylyltransferase